MTGRDEHQMGPPPGYVPRKLPPPPPADERTRDAALRRLRDLLAPLGTRCGREGCDHSTTVHRHRNPSAAHCGVRDCGCTSYQGANR
ncbi:hypothetical protein MXD62_19605 [Frankia sp. Mgl5]|uniref:hypothetical protein n=1 Tax=Frankia sp. Mgl5 TaxID=2933793 RepID=UPI00200CBFEA|nr:hypothetical protein [Frankia sp. Mgl5]MCK9929359.1 hypothetical protein [Frankia sp. Mgl5]